MDSVGQNVERYILSGNTSNVSTTGNCRVTMEHLEKLTLLKKECHFLNLSWTTTRYSIYTNFFISFPMSSKRWRENFRRDFFSESIGDDGNKPSHKKSKASKRKASETIKGDDKWEKVQQTNIKLNEKNIIINQKNSVVRRYETYCNIFKTAQCSLEDAHNQKEKSKRKHVTFPVKRYRQ